MASLPPLAAPSALGTWLGAAISDADEPRAAAVIAAASALVRSYAGQTWAETEVPDDVEVVVVQVAARAWKNPDGLASYTIDDYTARLAENADGVLHLTAAEKSVLSRYRTSRRALWTQPTTRSEAGDGTVWVPVSDTPGLFFPFLSGLDDL